MVDSLCYINNIPGILYVEILDNNSDRVSIFNRSYVCTHQALQIFDKKQKACKIHVFHLHRNSFYPPCPANPWFENP